MRPCSDRLRGEVAAAVFAASTLAVALAAPAARAGNIIDDWNNVQVPPPPALKAVTVDPKSTALLMLDFVHQTCNEKRRPRCVASLPAMKKLLDEARAHHLTVVYSVIPHDTPKDILPEVAPKRGEPWVATGVDKFFKTKLERILRRKHIKTVITVGTASHGAVLYTASAAAMRGLKVIVPVDGSSAENEYIEQYVAYNLTHAPVVAKNITLTTSEMIKF